MRALLVIAALAACHPRTVIVRTPVTPRWPFPTIVPWRVTCTRRAEVWTSGGEADAIDPQAFSLVR